MTSRLGQSLVFLAIGSLLTGCTAPITVVPPPSNGATSLVPVDTIGLKFGPSFSSSPPDGLLIDGTLYQWANFSPAPAAGRTSFLVGPCVVGPEPMCSPANLQWGINYKAGLGKAESHSLGISYTCGFFCVEGIAKFTFFPPYLVMSPPSCSGGSSCPSTTTNIFLGDISFNGSPSGGWYQEYVAIQNPPTTLYGPVTVTVQDVTKPAPATLVCATPGCTSSVAQVTIPVGSPIISFWIKATTSGPKTFTLQATAAGCEGANNGGKIP